MRFLKKNHDMKTELFNIFVMTAIVTNGIGVVNEIIATGLTPTSIVTLLGLLFYIFMYVKGFEMFGFNKAVHALLFVSALFEFPFLFYFFGTSRLPLYFFPYATIAFFMERGKRKYYFAGLTLFNIVHIILMAMYSPYIDRNNMEMIIESLVIFLSVAVSLFIMIVEVVRVSEDQNKELILKANDAKRFQAMVRSVNCQMQIDLVNNFCEVFYADSDLEDVFRSGIASDNMQRFISEECDEAYKERMREFTSLTTLSLRFKGKNSLSKDYHSKSGGWRRASFYPASFDAAGRLTSVLFVTQPIDGEIFTLRERLHIEETLVECIKTLTSGSNSDQAVRQLLNIVANYYGSEEAFIYDIDRHKGIATRKYIWLDKNSSAVSGSEQIAISNFQRMLSELEKGRCVKIIDEDTIDSMTAMEKRFFDKLKIEGVVLAPIRDNGRTLTGFLGVKNPKKNIEADVLITSVTSFVKEQFVKADYVKSLYELSYLDGMTGLMNRHAYVRDTYEMNQKKTRNVGVLFADINGLKIVNDQYGHEAGDKLIIESAKLITDALFKFKPKVYRIGGDEFVAIITDIEREVFDDHIEKFIDSLGENPKLSVGEVWINACVDLEEQVKLADVRMYEKKQEFYRKSGDDRRSGIDRRRGERRNGHDEY